MTKPAAEDRRLTRLTKICLALPEATRYCQAGHAGFLVRMSAKGRVFPRRHTGEELRGTNSGAGRPVLRGRTKTFAYFLNNHHGDGIVAVTCKVLPGDNTALVAAQPARFYLPAYIGSRGWVALRLDTGEVDWDEVAELVACSYRLVAPKRLAAMVKVGP
jgi:hypothetical protein